jgi:hypothetical protein
MVCAPAVLAWRIGGDRLRRGADFPICRFADFPGQDLSMNFADPF